MVDFGNLDSVAEDMNIVVEEIKRPTREYKPRQAQEDRDLLIEIKALLERLVCYKAFWPIQHQDGRITNNRTTGQNISTLIKKIIARLEGK